VNNEKKGPFFKRFDLFEQIGWSRRLIATMEIPRSMYRALIFALFSMSPTLAQSPATAKPTTVTAVTQDRDKAIYDWAKRHEEVIALGKKGPVDVVMMGDSILHYWAGEPKAPIIRGAVSWSTLFDGKTVANLGFGWDRVENVLWRVNNRELAELKPKTVVLLIGTNNLEFNSAAEIRMGIQAVCSAIHKQLPECTIHVLGILPRTIPAKIKTLPAAVNNELHQQLSGAQRIHFHDLSSVFLDEEGHLNGKLFSDGLHPNAQGYERLALALRPMILR
jgi:lysophospholipase L1-like esterase